MNYDEDFAYFSQKIPAFIHRIGTGNKEKGIGWDKETGRVVALHNHKFDIDEDALFVGIECYLEWIRSADALLECIAG